MKIIVRNLLLACAAVVVALPASAAVRFRESVVLGPAYGPWGYGFGPYYSTYGAYPVVVRPDAGLVKLDTKVKDAEVFVDGAFAGTVRDRPGRSVQ